MIDQFVLKIGNINIPQKQVAQGLSMIDALDETLDTATVIIAPAKRQEVFPMWENVWLTIDGVTRTYMVSEDSVDMLSKQPVLFKHTVQLIEPTKYLDVLPCDNLTFTKPSNQLSYPDDLEGKNASLWHVLRRIRMCAQLRLENATEPFPFEIDPAVESELKSIEAPQFFLNVGNVRDAVNQVLKYINAVARCWIAEDGTLMLAYDRFNKRNNLIPDEHVDITKGYITNYGASQSIQDYASEVQTYVSNLTSDSDTEGQAVVVYPGAESWASVRSETGIGQLTTENLCFPTPTPIYRIKKLELYLPVSPSKRVNQIDNSLVVQILSFDATQFLVTKDVYNTLPIKTEWTPILRGEGPWVLKWNLKTLGRDCALIYDYLGEKIYGLGEMFQRNAFSSKAVIDSLAAYIYMQNYCPAFQGWNLPDQNNNPTNTLDAQVIDISACLDMDYDFSDILYRVTFISTTDGRLSSEKNESTTRSAMFNVNQSTNLTDNIALGQNMQGLVQRLGQDEKLYTVRFKKYQNVWNIGDYTSDGYIVTKRGISIYNDVVIGNMTLNKNFNRRSQFVDLDSEIRQFVIPAKENSLTRHSLIKQYVYIGSSRVEGDRYNFVNRNRGMIYSIINASSAPSLNYNPNVAVIEFSDFLDPTGSSTLYTAISVDSKSFGNSIAFTFGFTDNRSAGNRVLDFDGKIVEQAIGYTKDGGVKRLRFYLANSRRGTNYDDTLTYAKSYPLSDNSTFYENVVIGSSGNTLPDVYKDPAEIWKCTLQFHFLSDPEDQNEFIIGEGLAKNHFFVQPWNNRQLALYALEAGERYQPYETIFTRGNYIGDMSVTWEEDETSFAIDISELTEKLSPTQSWCIGDKNTKEMYLLCNPYSDNSSPIDIVNFAYSMTKK